MRRNAISSAVKDEESEINLTPMLDVVFIMLIFFIVTANFIKEPGLEINRPDSDTAETQENAAILIAVGPTGEVWMDGRRIDVRQVKANVIAEEKPIPAAYLFASKAFTYTLCIGFVTILIAERT